MKHFRERKKSHYSHSPYSLRFLPSDMISDITPKGVYDIQVLAVWSCHPYHKTDSSAGPFVFSYWHEVRFKKWLTGSHRNSTLRSRASKFNTDVIMTYIICHNIYFQLDLNLHWLKMYRGQSMQTKHLCKSISPTKVLTSCMLYWT